MNVVEFASPNITLKEWQRGQKSDIDIFEDQLQGWVFDQAQVLASLPRPASDHSSYSLLALTTPYFEMITCYLEGTRTPDKQASEFLRRGLKAVLGAGVSDAAIKKYVSEVRNGIAHELMFRTVILQRGLQPSFGIDPNSGILILDPFWLFDAVHQHFRQYVTRLRSPNSAQDREDLMKFNAFMAIRKAG